MHFKLLIIITFLIPQYSSAMNPNDKTSQSHTQKTQGCAAHCERKCHEWDRICCPPQLDHITIPCAWLVVSLITGLIGVRVVSSIPDLLPRPACARTQSQFLNAIDSASSQSHACTTLYSNTLAACEGTYQTESMAAIREKYYSACVKKVTLQTVKNKKTD